MEIVQNAESITNSRMENVFLQERTLNVFYGTNRKSVNVVSITRNIISITTTFARKRIPIAHRSILKTDNARNARRDTTFRTDNVFHLVEINSLDLHDFLLIHSSLIFIFLFLEIISVIIINPYANYKLFSFNNIKFQFNIKSIFLNLVS